MPKRANGEGTICQRPDGTWMASVSLGRKPDGKINRKCFYGKTRKEVQEKMVACQHDKQRGIVTLGGRQTVAEFMNSWLEDVARVRVRETTYRSYEQITRNHIVPMVGKVALNKLQPQQVQQFLKRIHDRGLSADPIRRVLRAALNQAVEWNLIAKNPATVKGVPKREKKEPTYLTTDQAKKFLRACEDHRLGPLFIILTSLGIRISEALALEWSDIRWAESRIRVSKQLQYKDRKPVLVPPKSRNSNRLLPLSEHMLSALRRAESDKRTAREIAGDRWQENDFVFVSRVGTPHDAKNVRDDFKELLRKMELPDIRLHDLRHTCATMLLASGTSARVICDILGHSNVSFTLATYAHVMPELHTEAMDRMHSQLFPATAPNLESVDDAAHEIALVE